MANIFDSLIVMDEMENQHTRKARAKDVPMPKMSDLIIPNKPNYIEGKRMPTNSFGTQEIKEFDGDVDELITTIGADFDVLPLSNQYPNPITGELVTRRSPILYNSVTGEEVCDTTNSYKVIQFSDAVYCFWALLEEIKKHGYTAEPAVSKVYDHGSKLYLQYRVFGGELVGEPVDTYLTLLTSHDQSSSMVIALSMIRLFCQNQINRMLGRASNKFSLRHSAMGQEVVKTISGKVHDYNKAIAAGKSNSAGVIKLLENNQRDMNSYLTRLSNVAITNSDIFNTMAIINNMEPMNTNAKVQSFLRETSQLMACYNMPDVDKWRGTALGAYYAYSDFSDHIVTHGRTDTSNFYKRHVDDNNKLDTFIDTLIKVKA